MQMGQISVPVPCEGKKQCFVVLSQASFCLGCCRKGWRLKVGLATSVQSTCPVASLIVDSGSSQVH